eukprot:GEMP01009305.1.p1 GENE.GEMP01009305.1~~GEMP01009305.1.p1  ORF type:complete len:859 (+),score=111.20 GEMP01009305.1:141-2717(+)
MSVAAQGICDLEHDPEHGSSPRRRQAAATIVGSSCNSRRNGILENLPQQTVEANPGSISPRLDSGTSVSWSAMMEYVVDHRAEQRACLRLSLYFILTISSILLVQTRLQLEEKQAVQNAMSEFLTNKPCFGAEDRKFADVYTIADFHSWFRDGLLPLAQQGSLKVGVQEFEKSVKMNEDCLQNLNEGDTMQRLNDTCAVSNSGPTECCVVIEKMLCLQGRDDIAQISDVCKDRMKLWGGTKLPTSELFPSTAVLGGFRLRQLSSSETDCVTLQDGTWYEHAILENASELAPSCFTSQQVLQEMSMFDLRDLAVADLLSFEYYEYFFVNHPQEHLFRKSRALEHGCAVNDSANRDSSANASFACRDVATNHVREGKPWVKHDTFLIQLDFLTANRDLRLWSMTTVHFFLNRAGAMRNRIETTSKFLDLYEKAASFAYAFEVARVVFIISMLVVFIINIYLAVSHEYAMGTLDPRRTNISDLCITRAWKFAKKWVCYIFNPLQFVLLCAYGAVVEWTTQPKEIGEKRTESLAILEYIQFAPTIEWRDSLFTDFFNLCFDIFDIWSTSRSHGILAFFFIVLLCGIFSAFHSSPRLSFVTRTICAAGARWINFLFVLSSFIIVLSCAAQVAFGHALVGFADFTSSNISLYRLLYGDFPDRKIFEAWDFSVPFFIISTAIGTLIMMNIGLAILLEAYGAVMRHSKGSNKALHACYMYYAAGIWRQIVYKHVSFQHIYVSMLKYEKKMQVVENRKTYGTHGNRLITPPESDLSLISVDHFSTVIVPGMPFNQAVDLLGKAEEASEDDVRTDSNLEVLIMLDEIRKRLDRIDPQAHTDARSADNEPSTCSATLLKSRHHRGKSVP